jgi:anti-sigma B factor antagonist
MGLLMTVGSSMSPGCPHAVVELAGEADLNDRAALSELLTEQSGDQRGTLVLDMSGLLFMDSAILHVILVTARAMSREGGTLALAGPREAVRRILALSGADLVLPIYGSVAEATAR